MSERVVLTINANESRCGACRKSCMPTEAAHEMRCGYDQHEGCGAVYTHVDTEYPNLAERVMEMRPDLIPVARLGIEETVMTEPKFVYAIKENTDQTEGKGQMVIRDILATEEEAIRAAKGRGVMGAGDGEVWRLRVWDTAAELKTAFRAGSARAVQIWGSRRTVGGKWGYGYVDGRDDPAKQDAEFAEYARLKKKFEGQAP